MSSACTATRPLRRLPSSLFKGIAPDLPCAERIVLCTLFTFLANAHYRHNMFQHETDRAYIPRDWRIVFALILTFLWFCFLWIYIARNVGWGSFLDLPIAEMGAFLEGAFAFLAFLWLVIGLFIQQSVLAQNNEELRRNNLHSEKQTEAIAATELNARQETFFKIADANRRQLGAISGMLFISSQGPAGNNSLSSEDLAEVWKQFASGDSEVFS